MEISQDVLVNSIGEGLRRLRTGMENHNAILAEQTAARIDALDKSVASAKSSVIGLHRLFSEQRRRRPEPPASDVILRGLTVQFVAAFHKSSDLDGIASQLYPGKDDIRHAARDPAGFWLQRAATGPAQTTVSGWAQELVDTGLGPLAAFAPTSAYAQLAARAGLRISFGDAIRLPVRTNTASASGVWIGEGSPIPVKALNFSSGVVAVPHKAGAMSLFTRELARQSPNNVEQVVRAGLSEDLQVELDAFLFDAQPATALRPAGLLAGVVAIAASTAIDLQSRLAATLADLAAAIAPASNIVYATSPGDLQAIAVVAPAVVSSFVASGSLPPGRIVAIDADAFFVGESDQPAFDISEEALVHQESATPAPLVGKATPPPALTDIASPTRSLFQTATIGVRLLSDIDYGMRRSGGVAFVDDWRGA